MATDKIPSSRISTGVAGAQAGAAFGGVSPAVAAWMEKMARNAQGPTPFEQRFGSDDAPRDPVAMRAALPKSEPRESTAGDADRAVRLANEASEQQAQLIAGHLHEQTVLLKSIAESLNRTPHPGITGGSSSPAGTVVQSLEQRAVQKVEQVLGERPIEKALSSAGNGLRRVGNAQQLAGAIDGGVGGAVRAGTGRVAAAAGSGIAKVAGSKLLGALTGPLGYAAISAAQGAWEASHESKEEMEQKYGKGKDDAGHRIVEGGRQALSAGTFGLSEFAINEAQKHLPGAGHVVDAVANSLTKKVDSVRALWNPEARDREKKTYGTDSSIKAVAAGLASTLTGGISDLFTSPDSALQQSMSTISSAVTGFQSTILGDGGLIDKVSESFGNAFQSFDWKNTGIGDVATRGADAVAKLVTGDQKTTAAAQGQRVYASAKETAGKAIDKTVEVASNVKDWALGKTSQKFESGKGGAGTVSSGAGDAGGASYGTYQLSSKAGTLNQFLQSTDYGKQFQGLQPGTEAFNAKWKDVAAKDSKFGDAQHEFIKKTHFDPQHAKLAAAGIDLSKRGAAVQDAVWSTSVQFGGKTGVVEDALKGRDVSKMSDADIVKAVQGYKIANNDRLFKSSSANVRAGTLSREKREQDDLVKLAAQDDQAKPGAAAAAPVKPTYATNDNKTIANTVANTVAATSVAVPAAAQLAANDVSTATAKPPIQAGYQSNGIDWNGDGFYKPGQPRDAPEASGTAVANTDAAQAAQASVAPAASPAPHEPAPPQLAATDSAPDKKIPHDISSIGLLLFNTSVFS